VISKDPSNGKKKKKKVNTKGIAKYSKAHKLTSLKLGSSSFEKKR
jgi:hypothetical protein